MSLYDLLDIDENAGINKDEVDAIKALLSRIQVSAAAVAKNNDTRSTRMILEEMERMVRHAAISSHTVDELHQQFIASSSGRPIQALGAGFPAPGQSTSESTSLEVSPQQALSVIANDPRFAGIAVMLQRAALSIQSPGNQAGVEFDDHGDDKRIAPLLSQVETLTARLAAAEDKLAEERNENVSGSLANKLKEAEGKLAEERNENVSGSLANKLKEAEAPGSNPDVKMIEVDKVVAGLEKLRDDYIEPIKSSLGLKLIGKNEAIKEINKEINKAKN